MFKTWREMSQFIIAETGCKPFSGAGINYRREQKTTLLRSVDDTYYYDDNLNGDPTYTLFGHNGDQDETEKKFNEPLLNPEKTKHIYLYRVTNSEYKYIWYGKYEIIDKNIKRHVGKDRQDRNIIVLTLRKV